MLLRRYSMHERRYMGRLSFTRLVYNGDRRDQFDPAQLGAVSSSAGSAIADGGAIMYRTRRTDRRRRRRVWTRGLGDRRAGRPPRPPAIALTHSGAATCTSSAAADLGHGDVEGPRQLAGGAGLVIGLVATGSRTEPETGGRRRSTSVNPRPGRGCRDVRMAGARHPVWSPGGALPALTDLDP